MPTRLVLVRHALTTWHVEHRMQGRADVPLTAQGEAQALAVGAALKGFRPDSVTTSDLRRTVETARLMGFDDVDADPAWAEGDFGEWTGMLTSEVGDDYLGWREGRVDPPGGESLADMRDRVVTAARAFSPGVHLVVTHGGVIRALLAGLLGLDLSRVVPVECAHAAVIDTDPPRLLAYNLAADAMLPTFVTA